MRSHYVSSKKLLGNAKAAMISAIEIYNKPFFLYREECVAILLTNAWELLLKAVLNKHKEKIYLRKERNKDAKTLSLTEAINDVKNKVTQVNFPSAWEENIKIIQKYRNEVTHYYSQKDMPATLYPLFQASIKNFRDMMDNVFSKKLEDDINWTVLPLGINAPVDIVSYLSNKARSGNEMGKEIMIAMGKLQSENRDTEGLISSFEVRLVSSKKVDSKNTDLIVAINEENQSDGYIVQRTVDPNVTHPLFTKGVVERVYKKRRGTIKFTQYTFQAIRWYHDLYKEQYYWKLLGTDTKKYSHDVVTFIGRLSDQEIEECLKKYKKYREEERRKKGKNK